MKRRGMATHRRRSRQNEDDTATIEKDFFLNLLVVLLVLIGGPMLSAKTPADPDSDGASEPLLTIDIDARGNFLLGEAGGDGFDLGYIERLVEQASAQVDDPENGRTVLVRYRQQTPAGTLHNLLLTLRNIEGVEPLLTLAGDAKGDSNG